MKRDQQESVSSAELPLNLKPLLDERWEEYLRASENNAPADEQYTVQLRLYAAMRRLSESVADHKVTDAIIEIGSNLMGCEQMAVLILPMDGKDKLPKIHSVGLSEERIEALRTNAERMIVEVPEGRFYAKGDGEKEYPFLAVQGISAHVPLWQNSKIRGAIILYDLLPQKEGLDPLDRALLKLLAVYAGPCLFNS